MEMPIYEYQCEKCGAVEEAFQKFSDNPLTKCTHCSGKLHKLISQSAFHLKGSGWYVTDYAGKTQSQKDTTAEKTEKSDSAAGQSTTSDSKASKSNID